LENERKNGEHPVVAADFNLLGNYPNPFNPGTYISFSTQNMLPQVAYIKIYDMLGRLIRQYALNTNGTGNYKVYWDGRNESGIIVPAGNYIYTVTLGNTVLAGKMCFLK
jgi:hypothetical protein